MPPCFDPVRAAEPRRNREPEDRSVRRTWWFLSGTFLLLAALTALRILAIGDIVAWALAVAVALASVAAIAHRNAVIALEVRGRAEAENFARILSGLSRSVSVDAIVGAIVEDLAEGTGADHVVVARRNPEGNALEATLVTRRTGVPNSSTILPLGDLDLTVSPSSAPLVAIPIQSDGERSLVGVRAGPVDAAATPEFEATPAPSPSAPAPAASRSGPGSRSAAAAQTRVLARTLAGTAAVAARFGTLASELLDDFGLPNPIRSRGPQPVSRAEVVGTGSASLVAARIAERVRAVYGLSHTLAAPLRTEAGVIGAIVVSRRDREAWDVPARRLLEGAAVEAAAALARAYSYREATANASTDPLTGLPNRRYFDEFCGLLARRRRAGDAVAVLMIDIDRFKVLNDTYGHPVGDEVLKAVAGAIVSAVREEDVPARVGGEEFAVLLRNPGPDVALEVGERVRAAVSGLDLRAHGVPGVSVSVGVANASVADEPIPTLIERADRALLRAKRAGRDRVVAA